MRLNEFNLKQGLEIPLTISTRNKLRQVGGIQEGMAKVGRRPARNRRRLGMAILECLPKHSLSGNMILAD